VILIVNYLIILNI